MAFIDLITFAAAKKAVLKYIYTKNELELIERIIVGYNITTSEPVGWLTTADTVLEQDLNDVDFTPVSGTFYNHTGSTDYNYPQNGVYYYDGTNFLAYFINTGTAKEPVYEIITSPQTWETGTYYSYKPITTTEIARSQSPAGEKYFFKKILFDIQGDNGGKAIANYTSVYPMFVLLDYGTMKCGRIVSVSHSGTYYEVKASPKINGRADGEAGKFWNSNLRYGGAVNKDSSPISRFSIYSGVNCRGGVIIDVYGIRE